MVDRLAAGGGLHKEAVLAALQRRAAEMRSGAQQLGATPAGIERGNQASSPALLSGLRDGIRAAQAELESADRLPEDIVTGRVTEFHEIAAQIKRADLTLKYSLEIRNKLVDAYREVMRMSV